MSMTPQLMTLWPIIGQSTKIEITPYSLQVIKLDILSVPRILWSGFALERSRPICQQCVTGKIKIIYAKAQNESRVWIRRID